MNELERVKEQLDEANHLIESHIKGPMTVNFEWFNYQDKYLKPKDPREAKFNSLLIKLGFGTVLPIPFDKSYAIFNELFKEELNGTKGLYEAIEEQKMLMEDYNENSELAAAHITAGFITSLEHRKERLEGER